ncbi:MAG: hypothetical protein ACTSRG_24705 [Candidatus Helarchaeota archaeon]
MDKIKKNLILGAIKGYNIQQLQPFIFSLKRSGFKGDLVLFFSDISTKTYKYLYKQGVKLIPFNDNFPFINVSNINRILPNISFNKISIECSRYIMYFIYLSKNLKKYSMVMLTDVRDVVFQRNPFDFSNNNGICCFLEGKRTWINKCAVNSNWIKFAFGKKGLDKIGDNIISCSGVTIGETSKIMDYLKKMITYFTQIRLKHGIDQAVHNYLIYTNQLEDLELFENEKGPVYTIGHKAKEKIKLNENGLIINENGNVVNIIHQYDRRPFLIKYICKNNNINYTKFMLYFLIKKFISDYTSKIKFKIYSIFGKNTSFYLSKLYNRIKNLI